MAENENKDEMTQEEEKWWGKPLLKISLRTIFTVGIPAALTFLGVCKSSKAQIECERLRTEAQVECEKIRGEYRLKQLDRIVQGGDECVADNFSLKVLNENNK